MIVSRRESRFDVAACRSRSMSSFRDAVLLDVEVGLRDVRLGLVVVVVRDEVLDRVVGEELAELVAELRGQRLVVRDHERRALHLLDDPGHRRGLAGAGGAEQRLVALARAQPVRERLDRAAAGRRSGRTTSMFSGAARRDRVTRMGTATTPPYRAYAGIMGTFVGGLAAAGALARLLDRDPGERGAARPRRARAGDLQGGAHDQPRRRRELPPRALRRGRGARGRRGADRDRRPPPGDRRARHVLALRRHLGRGRARHHPDPRAAVRAPADVDARGRRR